jgi:prephenate dehydratase
MSPAPTNKISFQGEPGANSDTACRNMFPDMQPLPCPTFEDAFNAVETGKADLAMIPIENTIAGRVADIHHLLPESRLHIIGEYFLPIHFHLMVQPGMKRTDIKTVHSHIHALGQCRKYIRKNGWKPIVAGDTAGAAKFVPKRATAPWPRYLRRSPQSSTISMSWKKTSRIPNPTSPVSSC